MMKALLVKDLRMQRHVMVLAALLLIGPAVVYTLVELTSSGASRMPWQLAWNYVREEYGKMARLGAVLSVLAWPAAFGVAAARERHDRSGEFLESLPVSRRRVVSSRLVAATMCALAPVVCGLALAILLVPAWGIDLLGSRNIFEAILGDLIIGALGLALAGVAWMVGSLTKSEVKAALASLLTVAAVMGVTMDVIWRLQSRGVQFSGATISTVCGLVPCLLGAVTFCVGMRVALRRRTP